MHWPWAVVEQHVVLGRGDGDRDDAVAVVELHGDLAVAVDALEIGERVAAHVAGPRREHQLEAAPGLLILGQRQDRGDDLVLRQRQEIDERLAGSLRRGGRQPPDLHAVAHAARGEEQHRRVRRGDEDLRDEILVARRHARAALAAAPLRAIRRERHALDVALVRDGDDDVLALDQVLVLDLALDVDDLGLARGGELVLDARSSSLLTMSTMRRREERIAR